ncbi:putative membrane-associated guanylate kinase ww and pdz domain-containing protein 2 isoform 2 [Fasciola hepatica]|uniref:Membrane-associated guanylate kinase ww and pdz domain-containing protein 2 isoform 2 n=1 Tax=Fasciola hepatica TaxID=6192 RepID=A0A4E0RRL1_FASHE|nr:putative membrane-associated guanylate kinase ww and pdz domain-containing protein 2 isoform 2 [Fasciola hepatica]
MPFQWICGLSTNSGAVKSSSKTSTGFKGSEKYDTPQFQPNLPDAVAGLMPFRCPLQGVGISGPCKTPDYVPASHFLASTSHVTNSPLTEIPSLIVNPWLSDQPAQPASSVASVPVTLSPHVSPIVSSKFGLDHPANPSPSKSAVETKVGPPVNGMSSCFPLSEGPIKDNILPVTSVNHETLSALSNCIAAGDLLVAVDGQSVAGLNHDGVMQLMQLGSLSNSTDHSVRLTFRRTRKQQQDEPPDSPCPTSVPEDGNSKQPGNFRFRSFVPSKPNTFGGSSNASVQPGQNIPIIDVARMDSALPKDSTGEVTEDLSDAFNVNLRREENEGFGFVIVSSLNTNKASEIGRIIPGSPAERCGKLTVGNRIVAINGQMLSGLHHTEIVQLIRQSQQHLILTVKRPRNSNDEPLEWKTGTEHRYSACHENFDKSTIEANCVRQDERQTNKIDNNFAQVEITPVQSEYTVTLRRGPHGFGFSIRGGMDFERIPLFVFRIAEGGPAHLDGRMQVGDEIVLINGTPTHLLTHKQAVDTIRQSGENLSLLLSRLSNRLCETGV